MRRILRQKKNPLLLCEQWGQIYCLSTYTLPHFNKAMLEEMIYEILILILCVFCMSVVLNVSSGRPSLSSAFRSRVPHQAPFCKRTRLCVKRYTGGAVLSSVECNCLTISGCGIGIGVGITVLAESFCTLAHLCIILLRYICFFVQYKFYDTKIHVLCNIPTLHIVRLKGFYGLVLCFITLK